MTAPLILLSVALLLGALFLAVRMVEVRRDIRFFDEQRTALDAHANELYAAVVMGGIPVRWRQYTAFLVHQITHEIVHLAVLSLRAIERPLARLSYRMRVSQPKTGGEVSSFLKTITPDKSGSGEFQEKSV